MTQAPLSPAREKALFLSLWGIIILVACLCWLWPTLRSAPATARLPTPEVELAKNITPLFDAVQITPTESIDFRASLHLNPEFAEGLQKLPEKERQLEISARFFSGETVLEEVKVPCLVRAGESWTTVQVPNPQRYHPKRVLLYLAH